MNLILDEKFLTIQQKYLLSQVYHQYQMTSPFKKNYLLNVKDINSLQKTQRRQKQPHYQQKDNKQLLVEEKTHLRNNLKNLNQQLNKDIVLSSEIMSCQSYLTSIYRLKESKQNVIATLYDSGIFAFHLLQHDIELPAIQRGITPIKPRKSFYILHSYPATLIIVNCNVYGQPHGQCLVYSPIIQNLKIKNYSCGKLHGEQLEFNFLEKVLVKSYYDKNKLIKIQNSIKIRSINPEQQTFTFYPYLQTRKNCKALIKQINDMMEGYIQWLQPDVISQSSLFYGKRSGQLPNGLGVLFYFFNHDRKSDYSYDGNHSDVQSQDIHFINEFKLQRELESAKQFYQFQMYFGNFSQQKGGVLDKIGGICYENGSNYFGQFSCGKCTGAGHLQVKLDLLTHSESMNQLTHQKFILKGLQCKYHEYKSQLSSIYFKNRVLNARQKNTNQIVNLCQGTASIFNKNLAIFTTLHEQIKMIILENHIQSQLQKASISSYNQNYKNIAPPIDSKSRKSSDNYKDITFSKVNLKQQSDDDNESKEQNYNQNKNNQNKKLTRRQNNSSNIFDFQRSGKEDKNIVNKIDQHKKQNGKSSILSYMQEKTKNLKQKNDQNNIYRKQRKQSKFYKQPNQEKQNYIDDDGIVHQIINQGYEQILSQKDQQDSQKNLIIQKDYSPQIPSPKLNQMIPSGRFIMNHYQNNNRLEQNLGIKFNQKKQKSQQIDYRMHSFSKPKKQNISKPKKQNTKNQSTTVINHSEQQKQKIQQQNQIKKLVLGKGIVKRAKKRIFLEGF